MIWIFDPDIWASLITLTALAADGLRFHIPRSYLYFAIGFSVLVEALNLAAAGRRKGRCRARVRET